MMLLAALGVAASHTCAQDLVFNKLTINEGLSHNTVFSIAQDRKGFMWLGTREGLNRYDGNTILTFYANPRDTTRLASSHITALVAGDDGLLYVGTAQGLHAYNEDNGVFKRIGYKHARSGYINKILKTSDGTLLCRQQQGFARIDEGRAGAHACRRQHRCH